MSSPEILIVEDEPAIRQMYAFKLKQMGYNVIEASDGMEGLERAEASKPDLILLDLLMPTMGGSEMLEKMRSTDWGQHLLVIVLTNVSQDEAPMSLRLLKVEKYIVKAHYTPKQVVEIVEEVLKRYKKIV
jgi:DNA-binding response OmpR family regulator